MIPDDEHSRLLRAVRISATVFLLNSTWAAFGAARRVPLWAEIWENMVSGGLASLDGGIGFLVKWQICLVPSVLCLSVAALFLTWRLRRLSSVVLTAGISVALLSFSGKWMDTQNFAQLEKVIFKFQGA